MSSSFSVESSGQTEEAIWKFTVSTKKRDYVFHIGSGVPFCNKAEKANRSVYHIHVLRFSREIMKQHLVLRRWRYWGSGLDDSVNESAVYEGNLNQACVLWEIVRVLERVFGLRRREMKALWKGMVFEVGRVRKTTVSTLPTRRHCSEMRKYIPCGQQAVPQLKPCERLAPEIIDLEQLFTIKNEYVELRDLESEAPPPSTAYDWDAEIDSEAADEEEC